MGHGCQLGVGIKVGVWAGTWREEEPNPDTGKWQPLFGFTMAGNTLLSSSKGEFYMGDPFLWAQMKTMITF